MSDPDDLESDSSAIGRDANGSSSADGHTAPVADGLLTARRVAELHGRTCRTLRNWERRGWLLPVRIGGGIYYRQSDIEALIEHGTPRPASVTVAASEPASGALKAKSDNALTTSADQSAPAPSGNRS
jgi:hypothetical protein